MPRLILNPDSGHGSALPVCYEEFAEEAALTLLRPQLEPKAAAVSSGTDQGRRFGGTGPGLDQVFCRRQDRKSFDESEEIA